MPYIIIGQTNDFVWSMTAPLNDNSDLWKEQLSEDGKSYFVDGEWRSLVIEETEIKVKG